MSKNEQERKFRPARSLGQNFLADRNILSKICDEAALDEKDRVVEIGPGKGSLTEMLAQRAGKVTAIEKDLRLENLLREKFAGHENTELVFEDILTVDLARFSAGEKIKLVSNLPYNLSGPVLLMILDRAELFSKVVLTLQEEVARRISSVSGRKTYGSLSVLLQNRFNVKIAFRVPRGAFFPVPKVESSVVNLNPLEKPRFSVLEEKTFRTVTRQAFSTRRKTIGNSLSGFFEKHIVELALLDSGIDRGRRAESLSVEEFARLSNSFHRIVS